MYVYIYTSVINSISYVSHYFTIYSIVHHCIASLKYSFLSFCNEDYTFLQQSLIFLDSTKLKIVWIKITTFVK